MDLQQRELREFLASRGSVYERALGLVLPSLRSIGGQVKLNRFTERSLTGAPTVGLRLSTLCRRRCSGAKLG